MATIDFQPKGPTDAKGAPSEPSTQLTPEEQQKKFEEYINTPISKEDAEKAMANIDIQLAQFEVQRVRAVSQVNHIDQQIAMLKHEHQVVFRRTLNKE